MICSVPLKPYKRRNINKEVGRKYCKIFNFQSFKKKQFVLEAKATELNCYPFSGFTMLMINGPKNKIRTSKNATFW